MEFTLGEKIRMLRENKEITQSELGAELHMTQRKISYLEKNKYEPSINDIKAICQYFQISADCLLGLPQNLPYNAHFN